MDPDQDQVGAIDTSEGESYTPPVSEGGGIDTSAPASAPASPAPAPQASAGIPDMGPPPVAAEAAQDSVGTGMQKLGQGLQQQVGQGVDEVKQNPIVKRIASYLMGDGGLSPVVLDQAAHLVDPQKQLPAGDRNVMAIAAAAEKDGPAAGWALMQTNRVAFNAKQAFAYAALNGTSQKPPDLNAAVDAANQAEQHIPDGSNVHFAASHGGVTATVKMPGTSQPQVIQLSTDQFKQYLNVGGDGQWDKLQQKSVPATLQAIAGSSPGVPGKPGNKAVDASGQPFQASQGKETPVPGNGDVGGATKGKDPWSARVDAANDLNNDTLEARADRIYGANNMATQQQRNEWIEAQRSKGDELQNRVDVASEKGRNDIEKARVTGTARNQGETIKASAKVDTAHVYADSKLEQKRLAAETAANHEEAANGRSAKSNAMRGIVGLVNAGRYSDLNPQQKQMFEQMTTEQPQAPARPQARPQAQQPAAQQQSPQDQQALTWARANPADPRATKILQKLGVQ